MGLIRGKEGFHFVDHSEKDRPHRVNLELKSDTQSQGIVFLFF